MSAQAFTSGVLAERAPIVAVSHSLLDLRKFSAARWRSAAWSRFCGDFGAAFVAVSFWHAYRALAFASTARTAAHGGQSGTRSAGRGASTSQPTRVVSITLITSAPTASASARA